MDGEARKSMEADWSRSGGNFLCCFLTGHQVIILPSSDFSILVSCIASHLILHSYYCLYSLPPLSISHIPYLYHPGRANQLARSPPALYLPMGFFDHLQRGGAFTLKPQKPQVRKVVQPRRAPSSTSNTPERAPSRAYSSSDQRGTTLGSRSVSRDLGRRASSNRTTPLRARKRQTPEQRLSSDDDDDADDTDTSFEVRKRARTGGSAEPDPDRRLRSLKAFSEDAAREFDMVHAADITSVQKAGQFTPTFEGGENSEDVLLQYPSASQKERYGFLFRVCC